jgi:hypothetical protein
MILIALDVTNLTDARYFAAMGASMIGFDMLGSDIETINAIIPWVGVKGFMLQYTQITPSETCLEHSQKTGIKSLILSNENYIQSMDIPDLEYLLMIDDPDIIADKPDIKALLFTLHAARADAQNGYRTIGEIKDKDVYIEVGPSFHPDIKMLEVAGVKGIFVRGGEEEKTGVKSFEELDETLDYYMDKIAYDQ